MSIFDSHADKPNQINDEGQDITLRFSRIDDNTGKLTWNIPAGFKGCDEGVYNGIVLTVSRSPANYIESSPKNGEYYIGDPTVDPDLHAGSKLDGGEVLVLGAYYDDRDTIELEVAGLEPRTSYYFSGYAVDNVARYHREGVHSYSLPTGVEESGEQTDVEAHQIILLDSENATLNSLTGLKVGDVYELSITVGCDTYDLKIDGKDALTYNDLITTININLALLEKDVYKSPDYPYKNRVFKLDGVFYKWSGTNKIKIEYVESSTEPNDPELDALWFDTENGKLYVYEASGWVELDYIEITFDITQPPEGTIWFDGTTAWMWRYDTWCELNTIVSNRNPLLPPLLNSSTYWYDTDSMVLYAWNRRYSKWSEAWAIYHGTDPNNTIPGDYWYNEEDEKIYQLQTGGNGWKEITNNIRYAERNEDGDLNHPVADLYWFIPSEEILYRRDPTNTVWVELTFLSYPTDPLDRESCDLWWDSDNDVLYRWDKIEQEWVEVDKFFQTDIDPSKPEKLSEGSVWYNPETGELLKILDNACVELEHIFTPFNPLEPPVGYIWKNEDRFWQWNGSDWIEIFPLFSSVDPYDMPEGTYWLDDDGVLWEWNGQEWIEVDVADKDLKPEEGFKWFNTSNGKLYEWNIDEWVPIKPFANVEFLPAACPQRRKPALIFKVRGVGCDDHIEIHPKPNGFFSKLSVPVRYGAPHKGQKLASGNPMYEMLGVGDDGSPDERRELHNVIRELLGAPSTTIELSKSQIDTCIDNALKMLRKYSGHSYRRGFFFLDLKPNQQIYELKDTCVGFHTIVGVNAVHRLRSSFLHGAYSGHEIYGYAALKQLYTLGTFDILSFHLVASFIEELETIFATRITFQWVEKLRELRLYNSIQTGERVLIDAYVERTEQDLMIDRETSIWLQRWAIAEAKMALSQVRGKYQTLPGPNGSTTLNSQELITQSEAEKAVLMDELEDPSMGNIMDAGLGAYFVLG